MKDLKPVRTTPQDIKTIVNSFENYALTDIRHNKERPIAAFILSICFVEQLATFLFELNGNDDSKPEWFFEQYMPEYKGIGLYKKARNTLVHNYSSRYKFDIDKKGYEDVAYKDENGVIFLNTNVFIGYLEKAFLKAKEHLSIEGSRQNLNALKNSMYYPVLVDTRK